MVIFLLDDSNIDMPKYFFSTYDGGRFPDREGQILPDDEAVRLEAMRALPEIASDMIVRGGDKQGFTVLVTDEQGEAVYVASLTFVGTRLRPQPSDG